MSSCFNNEEICVISEGYPIGNSNARVFVKKLVDEWIKQDIKCIVIAPQSLTKIMIRGESYRPYKMELKVNEKSYILLSPKYLSFSKKILLGIDFHKIGNYFFRRSVKKTYKREGIGAKIFYGHFLNPAGTAAIELKKEYGGKAYFAFGEGTDTVQSFLEKYPQNKWIDYLDGVVSVNSKNAKYLIDSDYAIDEKQVKVFINAVDKERFYPMDRNLARDTLGFPREKFIISFIGTFDNRKGILRICDAIRDIDDIYAVFIGDGKLKPDINNVLYEGRVQNNDICTYLNASDVFVLPTLNEGCCNAIIEAMSCGIPVISSHLDFNADIMPNGGTIAVNPLDIQEIRSAVLRFKEANTNERKRMSSVCLEFTKDLTLRNRAKNIYSFLIRE